jgi:hypothetical protein
MFANVSLILYLSKLERQKVRKGLLPFDLPKLARTRHFQYFRWLTLFSKTENVTKKVACGESSVN